MVEIPQWKRRAMGRKKVALGRRRLGLRRGMIGTGLRQPVQFFKRSKWTTAQISAPIGAITRWSVTPQASDIPNFIEFQNLYDQYCIKGVKVTLFPKFTQMQGIETNPVANLTFNYNALPQIMSVLDYDDLGGSYTTNDLVQYQNLKMTRGHKLHSRYFKPAVATAVYSGGVTTAFSAISKNKWIDTQRTDVIHYGCYGLIDSTNIANGVAVEYDVKVDYYLAFKNVK